MIVRFVETTKITIKAYHIIGFKSIELGRLTYHPDPKDLSRIQATLATRFAQIKEAGCISARRHLSQDPYDNPGRSNWEDDLVGDDQYVFLSVGPRYRDQTPAGTAFGWVFDAEDLIERGAILGLCDLAADYTDIIGQVAEEVAETLPRLLRISEAELDEFMALVGANEPGLRQAVSDGSTDPESDLLEALSWGNVDYPGYDEVIRRIKPRFERLHGEIRLTGEAALGYLRGADYQSGEMEILVKDRLDLSSAVEVIR